MGLALQAQPAGPGPGVVTADEESAARIRRAVATGKALEDPREARLAVERAGRVRFLLAVAPPLLVVPVLAGHLVAWARRGTAVADAFADPELWAQTATFTLICWVLVLVSYGRWAALAQQRNQAVVDAAADDDGQG